MEGRRASLISAICTHCLAKHFHSKCLLLWFVSKAGLEFGYLFDNYSHFVVWSSPLCSQAGSLKRDILCVCMYVFVCMCVWAGQGQGGHDLSLFFVPQARLTTLSHSGKTPTFTGLMWVHTIHTCVIEGPVIS